MWLIHWWEVCDFRDDEDAITDALLDYIDGGWDTEHPLNRNMVIRVG